MLPSSFLHSIFITTRNHFIYLFIVYHQLHQHESEQSPGDSERQGSSSPRGRRVGHDLVTEKQSIPPLLEI